MTTLDSYPGQHAYRAVGLVSETVSYDSSQCWGKYFAKRRCGHDLATVFKDSYSILSRGKRLL